MFSRAIGLRGACSLSGWGVNRSTSPLVQPRWAGFTQTMQEGRAHLRRIFGVLVPSQGRVRLANSLPGKSLVRGAPAADRTASLCLDYERESANLPAKIQHS